MTLALAIMWIRDNNPQFLYTVEEVNGEYIGRMKHYTFMTYYMFAKFELECLELSIYLSEELGSAVKVRGEYDIREIRKDII